MFYNKFTPNDKAQIKEFLERKLKPYVQGQQLLPQHQDLYYFPSAHASFLLGDYSLALENLYKIISKPKSNSSYVERHYYQARVMELMIAYETNKWSHMVKLYETMRNYIKNEQGKIHPFELHFFKLFLKYPQLTKKERKTFISELVDMLQEESNQVFLSKRIPYINIDFWIKSLFSN